MRLLVLRGWSNSDLVWHWKNKGKYTDYREHYRLSALKGLNASRYRLVSTV